MIKIILIVILFLIAVFVAYFFIGRGKEAKKINWGINFSQKHAENLGLDWREAYLASLDDLAVKDIKLITQWDLIEPEEGQYNFDDLDWQVKEAEKREVAILLVIGMKTPRWPECHIPEWAKSLNKENQQERILALLKEIVNRYKDNNSIWAWQVENEPFFNFGECPVYQGDREFLKKEIDLVKSLDSKKRPVVISDTGEWSFWLRPAKLGDIVGTTIYRKVWHKELNSYFSSPFPPVFYQRRAQLIKKIFNKETISVELQAEPWGPKLLYDLPLPEQEKTMTLEQFQKNIEFAKKTGLSKFYLWGAEWWYWMRKENNKPEIWEKAKTLFRD